MSAGDPGDRAYVGRGGLKLEHALRRFGIDVTGQACADFGASTGGFTDCLLRHGAALVHAIDTAYGVLAWKLRNDPRVVVVERTNALHADRPPTPVGLVVADMGWTPQRLVVPAALAWIGPSGRVITLVKPHYESSASGVRPARGVLEHAEAERIARAVVGGLGALGARVLGLVESPILGGARSPGSAKGGGNPEWLALLARADQT